MSRRRDRGVALVATAAALAVVSIVALGLARSAIVDQHLTRNALTALQADALARSGVAAAAVLVAEIGSSGAPDTLRSGWALDVGRQRYGAGWVEVHIEDEARRLDLGTFADVLPRLLQLLRLDPLLADAIADWTDRDATPRPHGAERDWYLGLVPPYVPRNARLAEIDELRRVRGFTDATVARLRPYLTAAGEGAVNPNTASREVLVAISDEPTTDALLAARTRRAIDPSIDLPALLPGMPPERRQALQRQLTARGQHYTVSAVGGVGEAQRAVEALLAAPRGSAAAIVAWRPRVADH